MQLIFFGSDRYSATVLNLLIASQQLAQISVVTDRGKPAKNSETLVPTEVEKLAKTHNLKVSYYPSIPVILNKNTIGLCASWNHLLPQAIIDHFDGRLYNLHPSLLPQYRNVAPVPYAIALGDSLTGITLHAISEGIDNGEIVGQVSEPILPTDTAPILLHRLFAIGAELFLNFLRHSDQPIFRPTESLAHRITEPLIFTRRLNSESGYIEWSVLQKLLSNTRVDPSETHNPLLRLRLTHNPRGEILHDLIRGLTGWEPVWTLAPTKKGELRLTIESVLPTLMVKLAGKPKAISWSDFTTYYL